MKAKLYIKKKMFYVCMYFILNIFYSSSTPKYARSSPS